MAAKSIQTAMSQAPSIDDYLDLHSDNPDIQAVGKIAITYAILEAERLSTLHFEPMKETMPRFEVLEDTWYAKFFHALRVPKQNLNHIFENVSIITFNYDRCIEHYLVCALENYYGITQQKAIEVASSLKIFHPFGVVGRLDWLTREQNTVGFGGSSMRNALHLLALAEQIKTFYERTHDETMVEEMRAEVENAEVIAFLGFAFHRPNMDLIRPGKSRAMQRSIFATVKCMSQSDCDMIRYQLTYNFVAPGEFQIQLYDMTCNDFFKDYYRSLTR